MLSCKVGITPKGKKLQMFNQSGRTLPDSTIQTITHLDPGSVVVYSEITVLKKGVAEKSATVRYIVGSTNTCNAMRDPSLPDTLTAHELATLVLDKHVYNFDVSWVTSGNMYIYNINGNGVSGNAQVAIERLPSGTKVWIEAIKSEDNDGTKRILPTQIHVVR
jgi:hypothetical protein